VKWLAGSSCYFVWEERGAGEQGYLANNNGLRWDQKPPQIGELGQNYVAVKCEVYLNAELQNYTTTAQTQRPADSMKCSNVILVTISAKIKHL